MCEMCRLLMALLLCATSCLPQFEDVKLTEVAGSGVSAEVRLSYVGDEFLFVRLAGCAGSCPTTAPGLGDPKLIGHVHRGPCASPGEVLLELKSMTTYADPAPYLHRGNVIDLNLASDPTAAPLACGAMP